MKLTVWLNAFIPKTVPGYTRIVDPTGKLAGKHGGKTAVPLPGASRLNPFNLFKNWDAGYLTDQRDFSDQLPTDSFHPSVRMRSLAELSFSPPGSQSAANSLTRAIHESSGTTEVDMDNGRQLDFGVADMSRCSWALAEDDSSIRLLLTGAAADPLVSAAADIDYVGTFTITQDADSGAVTVEFSGKLDEFPAFECYAAMNGVTKTLFTAPPPEGNTVMDLLGPANRPFRGKAIFT
jgi:hypothetical protein